MTAPPSIAHHQQALTAALAKHRQGWALGSEEVETLLCELGLIRAEQTMTRCFAEHTAAVLDAFARDGVKLERRFDGRWLATTRDGYAIGETPWQAIAQVNKWQVIATQLQDTVRRHLNGTR